MLDESLSLFIEHIDILVGLIFLVDPHKCLLDHVHGIVIDQVGILVDYLVQEHHVTLVGFFLLVLEWEVLQEVLDRLIINDVVLFLEIYNLAECSDGVLSSDHIIIFECLLIINH